MRAECERVFFLGITRSANVNKNVLRPKTEQAGCIFLNNTSSQNHSLALIFNKVIFPRRKKQHANFHPGKKSSQQVADAMCLKGEIWFSHFWAWLKNGNKRMLPLSVSFIFTSFLFIGRWLWSARRKWCSWFWLPCFGWRGCDKLHASLRARFYSNPTDIHPLNYLSLCTCGCSMG